MTGLIAAMDGQQYGTGWVDDQKAVAATTSLWTKQGLPWEFPRAAPNLMAAGADDAPVFFWQAEERVLGLRLATWNQGGVGSCVGFGNGRGAQDLLLWEIACGEPEIWTGFEVAPEVVYGGSRVEIGGGGIRGDGSIGAWAADWLMRYGVVLRGLYGQLDLTRYVESTCRELGAKGIPLDLENAAKLHPVKAVAMVRTKEEGWAAIGGGKPIAVCSNYGFTMQRDSRGYCAHSGVWNHCIGTRGRFVEPDRGRSVVKGNSWGSYLTDGNDTIRYIDVDGGVKEMKLPPGHFAITWDTWGEMLSQSDSFAMAGLQGWEAQKMDWTP